MLNKTKHIILFVSLFLIFFSEAGAENNWLTQSRVDVPEPGIVETVLPPGLHCTARSGAGIMKNRMDLCLLGPDGNPRAFELYWREKGEIKSIILKKTGIELRDNKQLVWEGSAPEKFMAKKIIVDISDKSYVGKVDVEGFGPSGWVWLARNAALYKTERYNQAAININEGEYQKFRLYFSGYDERYRETPLFVNRVAVAGERAGKDYAEISFKPDFEEVKDDRIVEIRAVLPGSGIWINEIEITTSALFQGTWQIGNETILLGNRKFKWIKKGSVSFVDKSRQTLSIKTGCQWHGRVLIVRLDSEDYFGQVLDFNVKARLPRMVFLADQTGAYTAQTGCGKQAAILNVAGDLERDIDLKTEFSKAEPNSQWRPENLVEKYNIKGGPFNRNGFTWKAVIRIDEPGFYKLILNDRASLEKNRAGLRLVKNGKQVPYFLGRPEKREVLLETNFEYDEENNQTVMTLKLPAASSQWSEIQLSTMGIFERKLVFENHTPGKIGWQPWTSRRWASNENKESVFKLGLKDFPEDQDEIRLIIDHGDNQPLRINKINALYHGQDLFFLAPDPGDCVLVGGNPAAPSASYEDLGIILDHLLEAVPKQVSIGPIEPFQASENKVRSAGVLGGPFDGKGYTWKSRVIIPKPGFYRLILNRQASLEKNRESLRLVSNDMQVPYFMGKTEAKKMDLEAEIEYNKKENKTVWMIELPRASVHWNAIELNAEGVFDRKLVFEIRKPGNTGWQPWTRHHWTNRNRGESILNIKLKSFPREQTDIRLVMDHGDNRPLEVNRIQAVYLTQDLFFLAAESGIFELAGGNPKAPPPSYDLALIQDHVLTAEPIKITMEEIKTFKPAEWEARLNKIFSEQGWGLYAVLGIVTLILLIVIVRLFPKEEGPTDEKN